MNAITDNQEELFDIVNKDDTVVGKAKRREVHKNKNLIHRSIGVVVFNKKGELFLQQRSKTKDTDPLRWTISCSGHVAAGNSYLKSAKRELEEELGLKLPLKKLIKYLCYAPDETEMVMLYKTKTDRIPKVNNEEIIKGRFFSQKELKELLKSDFKISYMGRKALEKLKWL